LAKHHSFGLKKALYASTDSQESQLDLPAA
jgi:hypothetical protein